MIPNRPHILLVHTGSGPIRGSERVLMEVIEALGDTYRFTVLTNHVALHETLSASGQDSVMDDLLGIPDRTMVRPRRVAGTVCRLAHLIRDRDINLIHASNGFATGLLLLPALLASVPVVAHLHAPLSRRTQIRFGIFAADRIVTVARFLGDVWRAHPGIHAKLVTIHNGIRPRSSAVADRHASGAKPGEFLLITASVLSESKNIKVAIAAVRLLHAEGRPVRLLVAGDGPEHAALQAMAMGLPVTFLGQIAEAWPAIAAADAVLLPSRAGEAHSITLLEAGLAGVPRIASSIPGNLETVCDGVDALVFPPDDPARLANRIAALIDDPDLRARLGRAGRQSVERNFSLATFHDSFDALYSAMLAERNGPIARLGRLARDLVAALHQHRIGAAKASNT
jgi:glycosyltransferase involved in cell wall biosynthesis